MQWSPCRQPLNKSGHAGRRELEWQDGCWVARRRGAGVLLPALVVAALGTLASPVAALVAAVVMMVDMVASATGRCQQHQ
jgi:hypothetical protein